MRLLLSVPFVLAVLHVASAADKLPRVPPGFTIERVTTPELVKHPMMAGFDDRGRLFVACSAGKNVKSADLLKDPPNFITMLEDTNGDGKFDKSTIFADKMTFPQGALWYRNALYVASPPYIWKLEDTDNDGVADKRTILVNKFGFTGNAADIHGCFLGPTGRIYWCDGRHGHEFVDKKTGKVTSKGKAARIFSCKPDGSDVRVHCGGGMDNPVEIDFTETGEMIGSVNIMLSKPRGDCLVHWVEGGVYPRHDQQKVISEFKRTGDLLGPITNMGHVAVSGMMRYRGLTRRVSEGRKPHPSLTQPHPSLTHRVSPRRLMIHPDPFTAGHIFTTQFNTHKVVYSVLKRSGSTFTSTEHEFLQSDDPDFHPTDVLEDADGSLLVIDTGGWFRIGCPVSKVAKPHIYGAIYRIRKTGAHKVVDPRGLKLGFDKMPAKTAVKYLDDPRWVVREKAIERLALLGKESASALGSLFNRHLSVKPSALARRNAVRVAARIRGTIGGTLFHRCVFDNDSEVQIAGMNAYLEQRYFPDYPTFEVAKGRSLAFRRELARWMGSVFPRPRDELVAQLLELLKMPGNDRVLDHSIIYSLIRIGINKEALRYLNDKNPAVRRAVLIALDQMDGGKLTREMVTPLLDTDDPALQKTALEIIAKHPGWAKETLSLVRRWMGPEDTLAGDRVPILRGFLIAQSADTAVQSLMAELVASSKTEYRKRLLLLEVMQRSSLKAFPKSWAEAVRTAMTSENTDVLLHAVRIAGERELPFVTETQAIAWNPKNPTDLRAEALLAVGPRLRTISDEQLQFFTKSVDSNLPPLTLLAVARAIAAAPLSDRQLLRIPIATADALTLPVLVRAYERAKSEKVGLALVKSLSEAHAFKSLSAAELTRLFRKYPPSVQSAAKPLLAKLGVNPAEQERRIVELLKLADGGNAERGRVIFHTKKAACAACHTVEGQGGKVGPDLTTIGKIRQPRDLVEALAFPSATIARGFRTYTIADDRGKVHTGVISRETSSEIVLRTADLAEIRIPRDRIEAIRESATSIMPQGMDKTLSADELRDLLAFLRSLSGPHTGRGRE